jgi:putative protease
LKLLSPVDKVEEVPDLIEAGADELFCGLLTEDWHNLYIAGAINRRPGGGANFTSWENLTRCIQVSHSLGRPVYLTLNEHYYLEKQYPYLIEYVDRAVRAGVDGMMIVDLALMLKLGELKVPFKLVVSTGGMVFNAETARFYRDLGAGRAILPRHLTLPEIGDIARNVDGIELETFILNSRCPNEDGLCTFQHGLADKSIPALFQNACMLPYEVSVAVEEGVDPGAVSAGRQHVWEQVHVDDHPCGACALWDFNEFGITSVKIVGRGNPTARKLADLKYLHDLRSYLESHNPDRDTFRKRCRESYQAAYGRPCRMVLCYYPEVLEEG